MSWRRYVCTICGRSGVFNTQLKMGKCDMCMASPEQILVGKNAIEWLLGEEEREPWSRYFCPTCGASELYNPPKMRIADCERCGTCARAILRGKRAKQWLRNEAKAEGIEEKEKEEE